MLDGHVREIVNVRITTCDLTGAPIYANNKLRYALKYIAIKGYRQSSHVNFRAYLLGGLRCNGEDGRCRDEHGCCTSKTWYTQSANHHVFMSHPRTVRTYLRFTT
jgi:hypothetical protein